jgi:hypothetical protein
MDLLLHSLNSNNRKILIHLTLLVQVPFLVSLEFFPHSLIFSLFLFLHLVLYNQIYGM